MKLEPQHIFPQDFAVVQYPVFFILAMILRISISQSQSLLSTDNLFLSMKWKETGA